MRPPGRTVAHFFQITAMFVNMSFKINTVHYPTLTYYIASVMDTIYLILRTFYLIKIVFIKI
jgi:hypothetical protein